MLDENKFLSYPFILFLFFKSSFVQVHIVMPPETSFSEAHDVGESLQLKLESHSNIERAFVHVDYDSLHRPSTEHVPVFPR